jgi:hypothetical protein
VTALYRVVVTQVPDASRPTCFLVREERILEARRKPSLGVVAAPAIAPFVAYPRPVGDLSTNLGEAAHIRKHG